MRTLASVTLAAGYFLTAIMSYPVSPHEHQAFRGLLHRNVRLPLASAFASAVVFISLLAYLLSVLDWVEHSERVLGNGSAIAKQLVDMETGLRGYLLAGDEVFLEPYRLSRPKVEAGLSAMTELVSDNAAQVDRVNIIRRQVTQWDAYAQSMMRKRAADEEVGGVILTGRGKSQFDEIRRLLDDFQEQELLLRQERQEAAQRLTVTVAAVFVVLALALSGWLALNGRRELLKLSDSFSTALGQQASQNTQLEQQAWQRSGQTQLAEQNLGQMSLPLFATTLLQFLGRHLDAKVGALYGAEADASLVCLGSYGTTAAWQARTRRILPGTGMAGKAVTEQRLLCISPVAQDCLPISSGLGHSDPHSVVIVPLIHDHTVLGVLELGWFSNVSEPQLDFLNAISRNIASAMIVAAARQKTHELVTNTQQLNEELQAQQEELRVANEELEAQSKALEASSTDLERQRSMLERTSHALYEQTKTLDQRNDDLQQAQQVLRDRAQQLQQSGQYKSQFLANMSHELRTPLNSSLILSKLLSENAPGNLNQEQISFANTIYNAGNDLLNLINDILDIAKVEAGQLEIVEEAVELRATASGLQTLFAPLARQKQLEFFVDVAQDVPQFVASDRHRLEQILKNLLSNAFKFTRNGHVRLAVATAATTITFRVEDSGIGIDPAQHQRIFEAFQQEDGSTSRRYGGTGLGLAISRDLARLLAGSITLVSARGAGSTFTLQLPLRLPPAAQQDMARSPLAAELHAPSVAEVQVLTGRRILLVDDDVRNIFALTSALELQGAVVVTGRTGLEALEHLDRQAFDLVLMDVMMPDMDGLEAIRRLRLNSRFAHLPIIAVTARASKEDRAECLAAGASDYLPKPVDLARLYALARAWASPASQTT